MIDRMPIKRDTLLLRADRLGIVALRRLLCPLHCHSYCAFVCICMGALPSAVGGFAILNGYNRHRRKRVLFLMASGLFCIFAGAWWGNKLPSHLAEVLVTLIGSCLMISSHLINHTFCKHCDCVDEC